jgi:hypothetical protein
MDFDLSDLRISGRRTTVLEGNVVRELSAEDLAKLDEPRGVKAVPLKRLSQRHHALARYIAEGVTMQNAGTLLGYDPARISVLKSDPTFMELVEFYSNDIQQKYVDKHEVLAGVMVDAALEIQERLDDDEKREKISMRDLIKVVELGADRTGFGPTVRQEVNVNVNVANRLKQARQRVAARRGEVEVMSEGGISALPPYADGSMLEHRVEFKEPDGDE